MSVDRAGEAMSYESCVLDADGNCSRWNHDHPPVPVENMTDPKSLSEDVRHRVLLAALRARYGEPTDTYTWDFVARHALAAALPVFLEWHEAEMAKALALDHDLWEQVVRIGTPLVEKYRLTGESSYNIARMVMAAIDSREIRQLVGSAAVRDTAHCSTCDGNCGRGESNA